MPTKSFVEFIEKAGIRKYFKDSRFNPVSKTSSMTSPVGVDPVTGELYSTPYSLSDMTPFKITMSDGPGGYSIDKSFSEIKTAYANGRKVFLDVGDDTLEIVPSVFENPTFFNFSLIYISQADISAPKYVISKFASIYSDNSINYAVRTISESSITGDYLSLDGGVMQGDIDLGSNKILFEGGVAELAIDPESEILSIKSGNYYDRLRAAHPVDNDNDVATKKYVDDHSGGGGGTSDHSQLTNRDAINQHPMSAITGLANELGSINDAFADVFRNLNNKLSDAPIDGKQYARKNGAWAVVQSGGGGEGGSMCVNVTASGGVYSADKTRAQIAAAINAGTFVYMMYSGTHYYLDTVNDSYVSFERSTVLEDHVTSSYCRIFDYAVDWLYHEYSSVLYVEVIKDGDNYISDKSYEDIHVAVKLRNQTAVVVYDNAYYPLIEISEDDDVALFSNTMVNIWADVIMQSSFIITSAGVQVLENTWDLDADSGDSYDMVIRLNGTGEFSPNAYTATILQGTADALWNKASSDSYGDVSKILLLINSYYGDTIIKTKRVVYPDVWHDVHGVNTFNGSLIPDPVNQSARLSLYYLGGTVHVTKSNS